MKKVFYIDPQSYNNLSIYDYSLLSNVHKPAVVYFYNANYQLADMPCSDSRKAFSYSGKKSIAKGMSYAMSMLKIAFQAWRERPDVVHIQWFRLFAIDSLFVRFLHVIGAKIVFTAHNITPHHSSRRSIAQRAWYYSHVDAIIVHAERSKEELQERFAVAPSKVTVIPHGLLPSPADADAVRQRSDELRAQLGTASKTIFTSMGFQNYYKGIDIISEAWLSTTLSTSNSCLLLVVGKVQDADVTALKGCSNVVIVDEVVSDVDFDAYLSLASVVLLPYREISQSGVLLTALQRGVPVVVADVGGLADPLRHADVGWNIGEASRESLSAVMLRLASHPEQLSEVRNNKEAFAKIREIYSWEHIGASTEALYKMVAGE